MRIVMMVLRNLFCVPGLFLRLLWLSHHYNGDYNPGFLQCKKIAAHAIKGGNIKAEIYNVDKLPKEDGFILYPNHQGLFDTLMFFYSSPRPLAFVIKKEAKNIVLLKQAVESTGSLAMDRDDLRQSMQVINQVADEVRQGRNYVIFAEGTRSKLGNRLLDFKGGSFKAAQKAKCPIVPCALINAFVPFDEKSLRHVTVKLIYLDPIYYDEYKDMKTTEIAADVKCRIEAAIAQYE